MMSVRVAEAAALLRSVHRRCRNGALLWAPPPAGPLLLHVAHQAFHGRWVWPVAAAAGSLGLNEALSSFAAAPDRLEPTAAALAGVAVAVHGDAALPEPVRHACAAAGCRLVNMLEGWSAADMGVALAEFIRDGGRDGQDHQTQGSRMKDCDPLRGPARKKPRLAKPRFDRPASNWSKRIIVLK